MNLHLAILQAFLNGEVWNKYHENVDLQTVKEEAPEIFRLFQCVNDLHQRKSDTNYNEIDLFLAFKRLYPSTNQDAYRPFFEVLSQPLAEVSGVELYLRELRSRERSTALAKAHLRVAEGTGTKEELEVVYEKYPETIQTEQSIQDWIDDDLEKLYHRHYERPGLRWSLGSLNRSLGSLRLGDFGFIFARPETGKTTFLASQLASFASQVDKPIWWFTNEQSGDEILTRCYQAVLKTTLVNLYRDLPGNRIKYLEKTKGNIRIIYDTTLNKSKVERILKQHEAGLIIFDQIDPIRGFAADRDDLELTAIYEWARSLSAKYGPVIGVCQAGQSGDGRRWLSMNDVNNSKTGKQGAADWILGIGKVADEGLESYRYFNLVKNKLQTDQDSDPKLRHARWEVKIDTERAQYTDI